MYPPKKNSIKLIAPITLVQLAEAGGVQTPGQLRSCCSGNTDFKLSTSA